MRAADTGVMQLISDLYQTPDDEFADRELDLLEAFVARQRPSAELHRCSRRTTRPSGGGTRWRGSDSWSPPVST